MKKLYVNFILFVFISAGVSAQNVGIGQASPKSKLDINGGVTIGGTYSGTNAAPTNGAIIQGPVGIGNSSPKTGAILDLSNSSGLGLILPTVTSAPTTPATGMMVYNTTTGCLQYYNGSAWVNVVTPNSTSPTWVTNPATICTSQNTSYIFNSVSGASYQVTFTGAGNTVNGTNATTTALTVTASAATTTLTLNAATSGTLTVTLNGCTGNSASLTQSITAGYGTNIVDVTTQQLNSIVTTSANEIIIIDYGTYKSGAVTTTPYINGSTSGVTAMSANGVNSNNTNVRHYDWYYVAATPGTYTLADASGLSNSWAISNMAIKNTYGCPLNASNVHQGSGSGWSSNASGSSTSVTTSSVPAGAFLAAGGTEDGPNSSGSCSGSSASWTCSPQSGWAGVQTDCDGDGDLEMLGGVTVTTTNAQTVTGGNGGGGSAFMLNVFWIQYP